MDDFKIPSRSKVDRDLSGQDSYNIPSKELDSDDPASYNDAIKFTDKLFKSERHTFKCLKAIFGIFCGLLFGGIIFALLVYSFGYEYILAAYISIGWTLVFSTALAISVHARCITVLMIPSLFTSRGRVAILAVILGLLLSRPIKNITENASEVSRSMACSTELFHNQSVSLRQQLQIPIEQIKAALGDQADDIKRIGESIENAIEPIYNAIKAVHQGVKLVGDALDTASQECDRVIGGAHRKCVRGITTAYWKCRETLRDAQRFIPRIDDICNILDIEEVCAVVKTDFLCSPVRVLDNAAEHIAEKAVKYVNEINRWFQFNIVKKTANEKAYNISKTAKELITEIEAELTSRKITLTYVVEILNKLLALSLLLLLIQSFFYLKNYLAKDEFDNIYITTQFKQTDDEHGKTGLPVVLPLRKKEKKLYTDSNSLKMSPKEKNQSLIGIAQILLHMLLSALVVFLNYVLYYILYLVNRYGHVNVEITGESQINLKVKGEQMAAFINTFINNINVENKYQASYNTTVCLPNPTAPDVTDIYVLCGAYMPALIFIILQAYGTRYNRKICAFYYPEQENERILFLKRKILHNRTDQKLFMKQHVKSLRRQKQTEEKMSLKAMIAVLCPCFQKSKLHTNFCMNCGGNESPTTKLQECQNNNCDAVFCTQCFSDFRNTCQICKK